MLRRIGKIVSVFSIMLLMLNLTGCWGSTELEKLGIIVAMGIDREDEGFTMTLHIIRPQAEGVASQAVEKIWVGSSSGQTLFDASKNFRGRASANLTWMHNRIIMIGEETAKEGLDDIFDFLTRNREIRYKSWVIITQGKASDALQVTPEFENSLYTEVQGLIENQDEWSKQDISSIKDMVVSLSNPYSDLVTARLIIIDPKIMGSHEEETDQMTEATVQKVVLLDGAAVIKENQLAGWLTKTETRGLLFLEGRAEEALIVIPHNGGNISVEVGGVDTDIKPRFRPNGDPFVEVEISGMARIADTSVFIDFTDLDQIKKLENKLNQQLKGEIENSIKRFQEDFNADILGIGDMFFRTHTKWWQRNKEQWFNGLYQELTIEMNLEININNSGLLIQPIIERE